MLNTNTAEIIQFWFGDLVDGLPDEAHQALWYRGDKSDDIFIQQHFGALLTAAAAGQLVEWESTPAGRFALILLLDQFSRNCARGTAQAFAYDAQAMALLQEGLVQGADKALLPIERQFFYMPLQHSEVLALQNQGVALFQALRDETQNTAGAALFQQCFEFAQQHQAIIAQFGRFPHRNAVLERASTEEEIVYLQGGGARFGQ